MSAASISPAIELESTRNASDVAVAHYRSHPEANLPGRPRHELTTASRLVESEAPDGGYGWVVVLSCAVMIWWFGGISYSWGVFQNVLVEDRLSSASTFSFVGSLTVACLSIFAIINARLIRLLGARRTALLGVLFFGGGQILSIFTTDNIAGFLLFMVVSVAPAQYFSKNRGLANGIVFAGGGLGGAAISFITNALIQSVGPAWTYRTLGIMTLGTGLPAACLIKERTPIRGTTFIEWRLFRDSRFSVLFLAGAIATFPLFVPPFFLPLYSASLGLSPLVGASLVAGFNLASAVGRIGSGFLCDRLGPLNTLFLALSLSTISMLTLWPISSTTAPLVVFVIINGAANGGFFASIPTVIGNIFGLARLSTAVGMIVTGWAGGYLMGAPIAGYILAAYGGPEAGFEAYRPAIYYAGSMALASASLIAVVRLRIETAIFCKV